MVIEKDLLATHGTTTRHHDSLSLARSPEWQDAQCCQFETTAESPIVVEHWLL